MSATSLRCCDLSLSFRRQFLRQRICSKNTHQIRKIRQISSLAGNRAAGYDLFRKASFTDTISRSKESINRTITPRLFGSSSNIGLDQNETFIEEETTVSDADLGLVQQVVEAPHDPLAKIPGAEKGGRKLAIVYTCKVCNTRTAQKFTQRAYEHGVVLCRCPGCDNLHLIADRLGYFQDSSEGGWDIETYIRNKGESITTITHDTVLEILEKKKND